MRLVERFCSGYTRSDIGALSRLYQQLSQSWWRL